MTVDPDEYTAKTIEMLTLAATEETDFGGWLAGVLARAAAARGSSYALVSGRPGSWEADLVMRLIRGTTGWDDEYLMDFDLEITQAGQRTARPGTDQPPPG